MYDGRPATITIVNDLRVRVMSVNKEARSEARANVALEEETEESRQRSLTEKGIRINSN